MSDPERHRRLRQVLSQASELPPEARRLFLDRNCADDPGLRREVEELLGDEGPPTGELMPALELAETLPSTGEPCTLALPDRLGPHVLGKELGRGGMGVVLEARDTRTDEAVAVKVLHPRVVGSLDLVQRFHREVAAGRAVSHPNVVRTLEAGSVETGGRTIHYFVMELVRGRTLRRLLSELGVVPEALLREIARQVAEGLTAVHDAGVVHRDIKPDNLLITEDQQVRLMDLGVARLEEQDATLTREGQFVGSLSYAAPEQLEGGTLGPATDLHALGISLYELATGESPFRRATVAATIGARMTSTPPLACERNAELSRFFSEVVATLMAREPDDRFSSGRELLTVLEEGERGAWWSDRGPASIAGAAIVPLPQVPVRRHTELHGRKDELAVLEAAWQAARDGKGAVVHVEGEAGLGKSRLVDAILSLAARSEPEGHFLYGSFPPTGGMRGLLEAIENKLGWGPLEDAMAPYLAPASALARPLAAFVRRERPAAELGLEAGVLETACSLLLQGFAREAPCLWVVDDLHFAPREGRALAGALARAAAGHRALVVLTSRPDPTGGVQAELGELTDATRIDLSRLSPREVVELLREAFGSEELAERLGGKVAYKSDGVPFFVFEMLRSLRDGGFIERMPDGTCLQARPLDELEVPSAVRDLIAGRLRELSRDERSILDAAAIQGHEFDAELVADSLGRPLVSVLQDLAELERAHGLVQPAGRRYRFDHHQVQEVLHGELPGRLREEYHALFAEALLRREGDDPETVSGCVAHLVALHHLRGSRPAAGLPLATTALSYLAASHRNEEGLALVDLLLASDDGLTPQRHVEVLLSQLGFLEVLARREEQAAVIDTARTLAEELDDTGLRARVEEARATLLYRTTQRPESLEAWNEAARLGREAGDWAVEANALVNAGSALVALGRLDEALTAIEESLAIAREHGDRRLQAVALGSVALVMTARDQFDEGAERYEQARELASAAGDHRIAGQAAAGIALCHWRRGRHVEARDQQLEVMATVREHGDRWGECLACGYLGNIEVDLGYLADARVSYRRQCTLAEEIHERRELAVGTLNVGRIELGLGRVDEAETWLQRGRELGTELGTLFIQAHAQHRLGALAEEQGDPDEAERLRREAMRLFEEAGDPGGLSETLVQLGRCAVDRGDVEEARSLLDAATEAATRARRRGSPLLAVVQRARLGDLPLDEARAIYAEQSGRCSIQVRLQARHALWQASGEASELVEAHELLEHLRANAPEDCRESLVERVALHRAVAAAWAERG
ncbi:MAG: protein kinase [Acidobacteriota bacterium]